MKRIAVILLILAVFIALPSCKKKVWRNEYHKEIELENDTLCTTAELRQPTSYVYVLNMSTKKYHLQTCKYAINMKEENRLETDDTYYIYSLEYKPCGVCNPDR